MARSSTAPVLGIIIGGVALGLGVAALGGKKKRRRPKKPVEGGGNGGGNGGAPPPEPADPDPETAPDVSEPMPEPDPPVSQPILDRRAEGIAAMTKRQQQSSKTITKGPGSRPMSQVRSLVLHQMGFSRGSDPTRYDKVTAHFLVLPNGQVVWLHPLDEYLMHGNSLNSHSIGVEFAGNFPSANGNWWNGDKMGRDEMTVAQGEAGRYLVDWLIENLPAMGSPGLEGVYGHRQSSSSRGNDPGPAVWRTVGEYAISRGLSDVRDYTVGTGRRIPDSWRLDVVPTA